MREFSGRHRDIRALFADRFAQVHEWLTERTDVPEERRLLIGACFTHEYSFEAAALFNPSIVQHPDQAGLSPWDLRFILSLRATGEGHISSISFRSGVVGGGGDLQLDPAARFATLPTVDDG